MSLVLTATGADIAVTTAEMTLSLQVVEAGAGHASKHIQGGIDEIDGDQLDIDFDPSNYAPDVTPAEVSSVDHLSAHLYGIDQAIGAVAGAASPSFVYQPGGVASGNLFTDWSTLVAALALVKGRAILSFDDRFSSITIPDLGADQAMGNVVWSARPYSGATYVNVTIAAGATFTGLREFEGPIRVIFNASSGPSPISDLSNLDAFYFDNGARVEATGTVPLIDGTGLASGEYMAITANGGSILGDGSHELISLTDGARILMFIYEASSPGNNLVLGGAACLIYLYGRGADTALGETQTNFLGTISPLGPWAGRRNVGTVITTTGSASYRYLNRCNPTGGGFALNLPAITSQSKGEKLWVKNISASNNAITLTPAGADTIDGAASFAMSSPYQALQLVSDGAGNWEIIGGDAHLDTVQQWTKSQNAKPVTLTRTATVTIDASLSNDFELTLDGNVATMAAFTNCKVGDRVDIRIAQNGTGGYTVGWSSVFWFVGGHPTITADPDAVNLVTCRVAAVSGTTATRIDCAIGQGLANS